MKEDDEKFEALEQAFATGEYDGIDKKVNLDTLSKMAKTDPDRLLTIAEQGILNGKHNDWSMQVAFMAVTYAAQAKPELALPGIKAVVGGMFKVENANLTEGFCTLTYMAEANPKVAGESADAIRACMLLAEKGSAAHIAAREGLEKIEQIQNAKRADDRINAVKDRAAAVRGDKEPAYAQPNEGTADRAEEANKSKISPEVMKKISEAKTQRH